MPDYIIKSDAKQTSTLGKVKVLVEQVVGAPSQEAINTAVAEYIESHPGSLSPLSPAVKAALLQIAEKVAYIDENGEDYYDALDAALSAKALLQITAVYTQTGRVYDDDSLDSLKTDLVVTAYYDDGTSAVISDGYTLSGELTEGTSTITVTYSGKTATFNVTVSVPLLGLPRFATKNITIGGKSGTLQIADDGLITLTGAIATSIYVYPDGTVSETRPSEVWFSANLGDVITETIYDISWSTGATEKTLSVKWSKSYEDGNILTVSKTLPASSSGTGESAVYHTDSYAYQRTLSALALQVINNNASGTSVSFRLKLEINGERLF